MKKFFSHIFIFLISALMLLTIKSCGNSKNSEPEGIEYLEKITFEKDTNLYPTRIYSHAGRLPLDKYGPQNLFDQDENTAWETIPGTACGEGIYLEFDSLTVSKIHVKVSKKLNHVRVQNIKVYINDIFTGVFPIDAMIFPNTKINKLGIEIFEAEGINEYRLPVIEDSSSKIMTTYRKTSSFYNSKSAGIAELELFDQKGKKYPLKSPPMRKVRISAYSEKNPVPFNSAYLLCDNRRELAWAAGTNDVEHKIILFSFADDQTLNQISIQNGKKTDSLAPVKQIGFNLRKRNPETYNLNEAGSEDVFQLKHPLRGKNFELLIKDTYGTGFPTLSEIGFHDGSRPIQLINDTTVLLQKQLKDTVASTVLARYIDNRTGYHTLQKEYLHSIRTLYSKKEKAKLKDTLPVKSFQRDVQLFLRSNGTIKIDELQEDKELIANFAFSKNEKYFEGLWRIVSKSATEAEIEVYGLLKTNRSNGSGGGMAEFSETKRISFFIHFTASEVQMSGTFLNIINSQ